MTPDKLRGQIRNVLALPIAPAAARQRLYAVLDDLPDDRLPIVNHAVVFLGKLVVPLVRGDYFFPPAWALLELFELLDGLPQFISAAEVGSSETYRGLTEWAERTLTEQHLADEPFRVAIWLDPTTATYARLGLILAAAAEGADPLVELAGLLARDSVAHGLSSPWPSLLYPIPSLAVECVEPSGSNWKPTKKIFSQVAATIARLSGGHPDLAAALATLWSTDTSLRDTPDGARLIVSLLLGRLGVTIADHAMFVTACSEARPAKSLLARSFEQADITERHVRSNVVYSLSNALKTDGRYREAASVVLGLLGLEDSEFADAKQAREALERGFETAEITDPLTRANLVDSLSDALTKMGRYGEAASVVLGLLGLEDGDFANAKQANKSLKRGFKIGKLTDTKVRANLVLRLSDAMGVDNRYNAAAAAVLALLGLEESELVDADAGQVCEVLHRGFETAMLTDPLIRANLVSSLSNSLRMVGLGMKGWTCAAVSVVLGLLGLEVSEFADTKQTREALERGFETAMLTSSMARASLVTDLSDALRTDGRHREAASVVLGLLGLEDSEFADAKQARDALERGFETAGITDPVISMNLVLCLSDALHSDGRHREAAAAVLGLMGVEESELANAEQAGEALTRRLEAAMLNGTLACANLVQTLSVTLALSGQHPAAVGVIEALVGGPLRDLSVWPPKEVVLPTYTWYRLVYTYIFAMALGSNPVEALEVTERLRRWTIERLAGDVEFARWFDRVGAEESVRAIGSFLWRRGMSRGSVGSEAGVLHAEAFENLGVLSRLRRHRKQLRAEWKDKIGLQKAFAAAQAFAERPESDPPRDTKPPKNGTEGGKSFSGVYGRLDGEASSTVFEPAEEHLEEADPLLDFRSTAERLIQTESVRGLLRANEVLIRFFVEDERGVGKGRVWWWIARPEGDTWKELGRAELAEGTIGKLKKNVQAFDEPTEATKANQLQALKSYIREVAELLDLKSIEARWLRGRDVVIQADADILNLPLAVAKIGGGKRLCEVAASVTNVTSLSLRAIMTERAEGQAEAGQNVLSAVWLPKRDDQRTRFKGAIGLLDDLRSKLPGWSVDGMGWSPTDRAATGTRLSAAISTGQYSVVLVTGHGVPHSGAVQLGQTFPVGSGFDEINGRLWKADGADFSAVEMLVLCSCSVGVVRTSKSRTDLLGLYPDLAAKGARNVVVARYRVSDDGAPQLAADLIAEFAQLRASEDPDQHHHAARALNAVRNRYLQMNGEHDFWNAAAFAIYA